MTSERADPTDGAPVDAIELPFCCWSSFFGVTFRCGSSADLGALGGLLTSGFFSCVLLAELAVGRIIRVRKESSAGAREAVLLLMRDRGLSWAVVDDGPIDAWDARLRTVVDVAGVDGLRVALPGPLDDEVL